MAKVQNNQSVARQSIQPLFDYVLVKPLEQTQTTPSGIVLPDTVKEKPQVGQVMAVGPGTVNDHGQKVPMVVKVGQKVLYKKWGGNEVKVGTEEWLLIEQKDVMAVVA
ncbi:co-chaperone GroES [Candidatus Roizmanbacteria bacterium RIFCSPLOWO2_01_FULL_37_12]|uniref:Co-chaperonin GroES n=1 Tax=Candidatus Roizmanbacteria bacterium RIFCSPLOWO2_01_FULL_37_12 TaxID=1802056 RepID=A0A1F7I8Q2_9BACT|nr:MAG: co-chaperone GroES [Candidatus Roizmanbacteria bacterium RIFCSPHIGHO2_01_FULL_37_16]OGK23710.1 MAG: co-chaperone GroES [Candidatus Roizmanbacteria bacterium RIFCSPHIGHO2_02_FULL_37_9b]OGK39748.1 MAG: co-chaperone GroES [Candidatus Roizmanbacteria bacterium RIFCSPLOWO2_01_FULL_37_12]